MSAKQSPSKQSGWEWSVSSKAAAIRLSAIVPGLYHMRPVKASIRHPHFVASQAYFDRSENIASMGLGID
jgi:hypothetical protein